LGWCIVLYDILSYDVPCLGHKTCLSLFGTNRKLSRIDPKVSNSCPSCGCINEDTSHVVRCPSPGRTTFYNESVSELIEWVRRLIQIPNSSMIDDFLSGRGDVKSQVASLFAHDLPGFLASLMDEGGFDNLWKALLLL